jgi:NADP-dependent 3-hydroxy acid dehydrogenase YdfG
MSGLTNPGIAGRMALISGAGSGIDLAIARMSPEAILQAMAPAR